MTDQEPVPAATVVLVRQGLQSPELEVLLLKRNAKLVFHGGHWVFPGGRIDAQDYAACDSDLQYPAALKAAVRETREEAGIALDETRLIHLSHWTTPPKLPRRFCTWFFFYPLTEMVSVQIDNDEILEYRWVSPRRALEEAHTDQLILPRPTMVTLQDLLMHQTLAAMIDAVARSNIRVFPENSHYYRPAEMGYRKLD